MLAHKLLRSYRAGNIQQHATRNTCYSSKCSFYTGIQALRRRAVNIEPAKKKKWASWHEKHQQTMQTYRQATIAGLFPPTITKDKNKTSQHHSTQRWSHPQAQTKTKQRWSHHKSQAKAIAKKNMISPPITDKDCLVEDCSVWAKERHWIECRVCTLREIIFCDF